MLDAVTRGGRRELYGSHEMRQTLSVQVSTSRESRLRPLTYDGQMTVDTHLAVPPTEDGVNGHMDVDAPLKENVSIFVAGGIILPPPDIKCASHRLSSHPNSFSDACTYSRH